jgi:hypothetical protein
MDSGDNSVETTVIVMHSTIEHLVKTNQVDKLDELSTGTVEKKTIYMNEDKDAMEQTGTEVVYYRWTR